MSPEYEYAQNIARIRPRVIQNACGLWDTLTRILIRSGDTTDDFAALPTPAEAFAEIAVFFHECADRQGNDAKLHNAANTAENIVPLCEDLRITWAEIGNRPS